MPTHFADKLLDLVSELAWTLSPDGKHITYMNKAAEIIYGLEKSKLDLHESLWLGVIHPDDRPVVVELLAELIQNEAVSLESEFRVLQQDGTPCWLAARFGFIRNSERSQDYICVLANDITHRVRAEQQLDEARAIYESLVQSIPVRVFRKNQQGRLVFCNENYCDAIGKSLNELMGKTDEDLFGPELAGKYLADDRQVLESGVPVHKIEEHPGPDGGVSYVEVVKVPVRDNRGKRIGIQGVFWDVTERIVSQQALEYARDVAETASRAKSDFLASVSHEIRTPMNGIIGMTELLLDTAIERQHREYLSMIRQSAETLLNLINDLLDFSKIEAGKLELDYAPFDLPELIGDTVRALALRAHEKRIELLMDFDLPMHLRVIGDGPRLQQVITNLVTNAIKFTHEGQVLLRIQNNQQSPNQFHFEVIDTGIGIPPEKQKIIFSEFEQADKSTTRQYGGTGLGLAIASKIIEMMGSRIEVESMLGQGSRFYFTLTFQLGEDQARQWHNDIAGHSVVLIEDHAPTRDVLVRMLEKLGLRCELFESLARLGDYFEQGRAVPAVVLLDLSLNDEDPKAWVRQLRSMKEWERLSITLMTSGQRVGPEFDELLCDKVLKPMKASQLYAIVATALGAEPLTNGEPSSIAIMNDQPLRILLAEDNQINQRLACAILEKFGHRITVARDGAEVLELFGNAEFDLILMDVQMPKIDGIEATRQIRDRERSGHHIPIVALSAHTYQGFREQCLEAGMDDYLSKPLRRNTLLTTIEKLTGRRSGIKNSGAQPQPLEREVDWRQAFETVGGDRKLLSDLIDVFLEEHPQMLADIDKSIEANDFVSVGRVAHGVKGALNYLGALRAVTVARKLEEMAPTRNADACRTAMQELKKLLKSLTFELQKFKNKGDEKH